MKTLLKPLYSMALCGLLFPLAGVCQQVVAPTQEPVGPSQGSTWADYAVSTSFETGYRFHSIGGNSDSYRSSVNFGNGVRLLGASIAMHSKDGHGRWFDELLLSTIGLGGDPYQSATFRIQKNRWYRYDLLWRQNDYFNPGLVTDGANGTHLLDTNYTSQNHDLTILPQSKVQFFLGYTRDNQNGAGISTVPAFDITTAFPVFENVRHLQNEFRVGNELRFHGFRLNWTRGWQDFKDDSGFNGASGPAIPATNQTLNSFIRAEPYHGASPYWRVGLFFERKWFNINGRFNYAAGRRGFLLDETAVGTLVGAVENRQVTSFGSAQRPVASGDLTISILPTAKLTIVNQTATYSIRTEGDSAYAEVDNGAQAANFIFFEYLGIFTVANQTDVNYRAKRWLGIYGGYHYSDRRIRSIQQPVLAGVAAGPAYEETNILNTGLAGIRVSLPKGLTLTADGEVGRANRPFAPKSERDYHALAGQLRYQFKSLRLSAASHAEYNANSVTFTAFSSHARSYTASASWGPLPWFGFDASYSKLHLDTIGGIAYFAGPSFIQGEQSYYVSNIHSGNLGVRLALKKYADLYVGYSIVQDTGDGRGDPLGKQIASSNAAFQAAQTFPMRFQSALARLSYRLTDKIRVNFGYQRYGYREDFYAARGYRADTGYASVLWSF